MLTVNNQTTFHPLMQPLIMFISSSVCITIYIFKNKNPSFMVKRKKFKWRYLLIPTLLMLINVFQMVIGLRYLYNGLYTIMKSISIMSSIVMEKCFYPHRSYTKNQITGLVLTILGQAAIGIYSLFLSYDIIQIDSNLQTNIILGLTLLLISIFPMAFYYLLQERFMKAFRLDPLQYVGTQGLINSFVTIVLILCFQWTPCNNSACQFQVDKHFYMDRIDIWWDQLSNSHIFLSTVLILLVFFAIQMYLEFFIMKHYSGIACNVMSSLYTMVPYLYGLIAVHWFEFSFIHLIGFLTLIAGVLIFYHIPNFSQFQDSDSPTTTHRIPRPQPINSPSLFSEFPKQNSPQRNTNQEADDLNLDDEEYSEGSINSKNKKKNKKQYFISPADKNKTNNIEYENQTDERYQYNPPIYSNYSQEQSQNNKERSHEQIKSDQKANPQYNQNSQNYRYYQEQEIPMTQYNNNQNISYPNNTRQNPIIYNNDNQIIQSEQIRQNLKNNQNKQIPFIINVNNQENLIYNRNMNCSPPSYTEGRLSYSANNQYQQKYILKSQNSQSNNDEDDNSSVYYNNKFAIENKGQINTQQQDNNTKISDDSPSNKDLIKNRYYQNNNNQSDKAKNDQNTTNNQQEKVKHINSGLWINQPNQRNKSNMYDQSILLLGSQISENGQSLLFLNDTTPKNNQQQTPTADQINEDQNIRLNSSFTQRDFEIYVEGKSSVFQQQSDLLQQTQNNNNNISNQGSAVKNNDEDILRNKSSFSNRNSLSSPKKQKYDKKLQPINFKEDILLNQGSQQQFKDNQQDPQIIQQNIKQNYQQNINQIDNSNQKQIFENENEQIQQNNTNINQDHSSSIQISTTTNINQNQKPKKKKKLLILNI